MALQPGRYRARVVGYDFSLAKTGTPQIRLDFELANGQSLTDYRAFTHRSAQYREDELRACGWHGDNIDRMLEDGLGSVDVQLVLEEEEYQGKTRVRLQYINALSTSSPEERAAAADQISSLLADLRRGTQSQPKQRRQHQQQRPASDGWGQAAPADDDKIPF